MLIFKARYIIVFMTILLSGCVVSQINNTETKSNEAVIFGRLVITGEEEINYRHMIAYLYSEDGSPIMAKLDKDGYFYTKAPLGRLYLERFDYIVGLKFYSILAEYKFANITQTDEVYYIGDINVNWSPTKESQINKITLKVEKPMREVLPITPLNIEIDNHTIGMLNKQFPENKKSIRISVLE
ncbi:hypothetical protein JGH11_06740 [Dysgonomonas sp. Marseille-P4677]|uniref:hypothetical protein n=1 Tax=Dysgonomonas sp. Marseille-P4677 TaxID=2364790 RepID=UPI001912C53C|nr:hypothetical protein [Dysgonomonas sp. Marseille-P4677]MBK5720564.1 hypothetical protein [Dysgonomonas sp. Marseille-P4677]